MPSNRDNDDVRDPMEEDDLIGANDEEEDDEEEDEDGDILDEEDEDELDQDDEETEGDDEISASGRSDVTEEVGSEGGSPGEAVDRVHARAGLGWGSEATTTWNGGDDRTRDRRDEDDVLIRRAPRG